MTDRRFYVYVHRRATDGTIFYVGKGCGNRHLVSFGRNDWWQRVAAKHGWRSEIVTDGLTNKEAMAAEKALIAQTENLVNLTSGGEGFEIYPAAKEKMRQAKLGRRQSPEHAHKSRTNKIGKKQPASAIEALRLRKSKRIINSDGEIFPSASEAARVFSARFDKYCSQGNICNAATAGRANAYGVSWSYNVSQIPEFQIAKGNAKAIVCVETGEIFPSARMALEWVISWRGDGRHQCVTQAARSGGKAYGHHWKYTDAA